LRKLVAPEAKRKTVDLTENEIERDVMTPAHRNALRKWDEKQEFLYPLERITQSKVCFRKEKFPGADEAYPHPQQALYRFVSKYYPYAVGGPLYVDEPQNETEIHRAYERQKVMKKLKLRYLIVERDSTYDMLLEQLGEL
jgi:hypothetical protein